MPPPRPGRDRLLQELSFKTITQKITQNSRGNSRRNSRRNSRSPCIIFTRKIAHPSRNIHANIHASTSRKYSRGIFSFSWDFPFRPTGICHLQTSRPADSVKTCSQINLGQEPCLPPSGRCLLAPPLPTPRVWYKGISPHIVGARSSRVPPPPKLRKLQKIYF